MLCLTFPGVSSISSPLLWPITDNKADVIGRKGPRLVRDLDDIDDFERVAEAKSNAMTIERLNDGKTTLEI